MTIDTRLLTPRDMPALLAIEDQAFDPPWSAQWFEHFLTTGSLALVAIRGGRLCGYIVYRLYPDAISVHRLVVANAARREGVGTRLLGKVKRHLGNKRRVLYVSASEPGAQAFLRRQGFAADRYVRAVDSFVFAYRVRVSRKAGE